MNGDEFMEWVGGCFLSMQEKSEPSLTEYLINEDTCSYTDIE